MAEFGNPEVVEEEVDILLIGGGMACCGAGYELGPWLEAAKAAGHDLKVKLVDKAAMGPLRCCCPGPVRHQHLHRSGAGSCGLRPHGLQRPDGYHP